MGKRYKKSTSRYDADKVSPWLAISTIVLLLVIFSIAGLIIHRIYIYEPPPRTIVERDLTRFKEKAQRDPGNASLRIALAELYLDIGKYGEAQKEAEAALEIDPEFWMGHFQMGLIMLEKKEPDKAINYLETAALLEPENEITHYTLGHTHMEQDNFESAIKYFERSLEIKPALADGRYHLGYCYEQAGRIEDARKEYEEALRYIPDYKQARDALMRLGGR